MLCPFELAISPMESLAVLDFKGDPNYDAFELQSFDDDEHGSGVLAMLRRRDRKVDCYYQPGLRLDRAEYEIGAGVGEWVECAFQRAALEVRPTGVYVDAAFQDKAGREIEVRVLERDGRTRRPTTLLAPVGDGVEDPRSLFLVYMYGFDMVRRTGTDISVSIGGELREPTVLPLPVGWHRTYLARYAADPVVAVMNPRRDGLLAELPVEGPGTLEHAGATWTIVEEKGRLVLRAITLQHGRHKVRWVFAPSIPDLRSLNDGDDQTGRWTLAIDGARPLIAGDYSVERKGDSVETALDITQGWKPWGLGLSYRLLTSLMPMFRRWPTTYHWDAVVKLDGDGDGDQEPTIRSRWLRTR